MKTVTITGHRPEKLSDERYVLTQLQNAYIDLDAGCVIQGMAAGVDLLAARAAFRSRVPFKCYVPWKGHSSPRDHQSRYMAALEFAEDIVYCSDSLTYPGPYIYQVRNERMVDDGDIVLAVWDGSPGGTKNCVQYALKKGVPVYRIYPDPAYNQLAGWLN